MVLRLIQLESEAGERQCAVVHDDGSAVLIEGYSTTYELCLAALRAKKSMNEFIAPTITKGVAVDYDAALEAGRVLPPIDHPDPAHSVRSLACAHYVPRSAPAPAPPSPRGSLRPQNVTGTGLTHLGSAAGRDKMHSGGEDKSAEKNLTDSMKMFNMVSWSSCVSGRVASPHTSLLTLVPLRCRVWRAASPKKATACSRSGSTKATAQLLSSPADRSCRRSLRSMAARSPSVSASTSSLTRAFLSASATCGILPVARPEACACSLCSAG
jgi:hypothetical protein